MPTAEQRDQMRAFQNCFRETNSVLMVDFLNDGILSGGCIAGGWVDFHINHHEDAEPVILCNFATNDLFSLSINHFLIISGLYKHKTYRSSK